MKIATWNINGLQARRDELVVWLREKRIDIVGLQETKTSDDDFRALHQPKFEAEGYCAAFRRESGSDGIAILSRWPLELIHEEPATQLGLGARLLAVNTAGLSFTTICVPSASGKRAGGMKRKLAWLDSLSGFLREHGTEDGAAVLCGDFNITPAPVDNWRYWDQQRECKSKPSFTDDERSRIRSLGKTGWFDLVRELNPDRRVFSWWSPQGDLYRRDKGLRIDLVFGNQAIRERLRAACIDRSPIDQRVSDKKWDHAPVIVDLD